MAEVVSTNEFKNGMHIELEGSVWRIVEFQHVKPGKGGAFVRTKVKSVDSGSVVDKTFRAGEKFRPVRTESRRMQFLYDSGEMAVFMDSEDSRIDKGLEDLLGVQQFAAIEVGDEGYILAFNVAPGGHGGHGDDILFSLGILRHSINQKIRRERMEGRLGGAEQGLSGDRLLVSVRERDRARDLYWHRPDVGGHAGVGTALDHVAQVGQVRLADLDEVQLETGTAALPRRDRPDTHQVCGPSDVAPAGHEPPPAVAGMRAAFHQSSTFQSVDERPGGGGDRHGALISYR